MLSTWLCTAGAIIIIRSFANGITGSSKMNPLGAATSVDGVDSLLTPENVRYLVDGLNVLLVSDLDGEKRAKVIRLRDQLTVHISSVLNEYYAEDLYTPKSS